MNKTLDKELKAYKRSIQRQLPLLNRRCHTDMKVIFAQINTFAEENPEATMADIQRQFGSSKSAAHSILSAEEISACKKHNVQMLIMGAVAAILLAVLVFFGMVIYEIYNDKNMTTTYGEPEVITPLGPAEPNEGREQ
ncbi:MAG: hypothetical protein E7644_05700 [Ruminococcaceae bacterium]|nr:hypothetical protein [Oscillospiraceae bacterium]